MVVTGLGTLGSFGQGISALTEALHLGQSHFTHSTKFPDLSFPTIIAELQNFVFDEALQVSCLPKELFTAAQKAGRRTPITVQASLIAALEAWQQAKLSERNINPLRIGLIIAGSNTTQAYQHKIYKTHAQELNYLPPTYALHFMDTDQIGTLSEVLGIKGESFTVGGASASANVAIIQGCRLIQQGILDICLVVGVLADLSPVELQGFYNIGALGGRKFQKEPSKACRPFDKDHEGFILGQASGCLVLEAFEFAKEHGMPVLGEVLGAGFVLDGHRLSEPNVSGEANAMQQALHNASLAAKNIDYINTHGSSSPAGDTTELAAISSVFGKELNQIWMNASKGIVGHCLWSAGIIEAIATLIQLRYQFVHPNLNLDNPINSICRFVGKQSESTTLQIAISNSFGFGGINTSVILKKGDNDVRWH